jgi:tetratricopeptide (TPR) repeat protein
MRREALDALRRLYRTKNETEKLYETLQRLHESSPKEAPITADLARLGLNLDQNNKQAQDLAKEAYNQAPSEANCAVTYAFALDRLGRNAEGLEIIKKLPSNQLHDPHAAVYVALLLANANQVEAAKDYIASTDETKIYVEEKKLLDEARARLAAASSTPSPPVSPSPAELSPTPTSTLSPAPTPAPSLTPARSTS